MFLQGRDICRKLVRLIISNQLMFTAAERITDIDRDKHWPSGTFNPYFPMGAGFFTEGHLALPLDWVDDPRGRRNVLKDGMKFGVVSLPGLNRYKMAASRDLIG